MTDAMTGSRRAEIAGNLAAVEERLAAACTAAGRDRTEVTLIAVTKTFPSEDVRHLHALGVREVGENRHQEAEAKVAACLARGLDDLRWHFVGQVQGNKAAAVAAYAHVVHSVDRVRLVSKLDRGARTAGRSLECLVQVDLRQPPREDGRGGAAPSSVADVAEAIEGADALRLGGVMAVAPLAEDPGAAFGRLAEVAAALRASCPTASVVSAGMSGDLEQAVAAGATHLRVGSALLGSRPPLG